jgi:hypothetical protein
MPPSVLVKKDLVCSCKSLQTIPNLLKSGIISLQQKHPGYPLVICYIAIENGPVEIVDLPTKNGDFPWLCKRLPEGKSLQE